MRSVQQVLVFDVYNATDFSPHNDNVQFIFQRWSVQIC